MQAMFDKAAVLWDGVKTGLHGVTEGVKSVGQAGKTLGLAQMNETFRDVDTARIMGLCKRYWHIVMPACGVVVMGIVNVAVLSADQSERPVVASYGIRCMDCRHTQRVERDDYVLQFSRTGESDYVSDPDNQACQGCGKAFVSHALVICPACSKEFVMGRPATASFPGSIRDRVQYCTEHENAQKPG